MSIVGKHDQVKSHGKDEAELYGVLHRAELDVAKQPCAEVAPSQAGPPSARELIDIKHTGMELRDNVAGSTKQDHQRTWRDVAAQGVVKKN